MCASGDPLAGAQGASGGIDPDDAEGAQLARLGGIVRSLSDEDLARDEPPPRLWDAIVARSSGAAPPGGTATVVASTGAPPSELVPLQRKPRRTSVRARFWRWVPRPPPSWSS